MAGSRVVISVYSSDQSRRRVSKDLSCIDNEILRGCFHSNLSYNSTLNLVRRAINLAVSPRRLIVVIPLPLPCIYRSWLDLR